MNRHEITEKKLRRADHYRIQGQFDSRTDKLLYAILYTLLIKPKFPKIAERIRNEGNAAVMKMLLQEIRTMIDTNTITKSEIYNLIKENVYNVHLLEESWSVVKSNL